MTPDLPLVPKTPLPSMNLFKIAAGLVQDLSRLPEAITSCRLWHHKLKARDVPMVDANIEGTSEEGEATEPTRAARAGQLRRGPLSCEAGELASS